MLEAMLEADVDELEGRGSGALARHVRECAKCGAVAQKLVADSQLLGVVVRRSAPLDFASFAARTRFSRRTLVGGGVAAIAASVLFVLLVQKGMRGYAEGGPALGIVHRAVPATPGLAPGRLPMAASPDSVRAGAAIPAGAHRVEPQRFADAMPIVPVVFEVPAAVADKAAVAEVPVVSVTPPPGKRAMVWRGRNPKITVVWLY
jgi:hypothetical protein